LASGRLCDGAAMEQRGYKHNRDRRREIPMPSGVYKGIVHAAIYDAVVGIEGGYEPYTYHAAASAGASPDAAAAQAADDILAVLVSGDQFRPNGPPALDSRQYAADLAETRRLGTLDSTGRIGKQTETALFYVEHAVPQFTRALGRLAVETNLTRIQAARMLALTAIASGDACIACFDAKYHYSFWRPVTALRTGSFTPDPAWSPLIPTPNHPSYP